MNSLPEEIITVIERLVTYFVSGGEPDKEVVRYHVLWGLSDACIDIDNKEVLDQVERSIDFCMNQMKEILAEVRGVV